MSAFDPYAHPLVQQHFVVLTRDQNDEGVPAGLAVSFGHVLFALPDGIHFMVESRPVFAYMVYMPKASDPVQRLVTLEEMKTCVWYEDEDDMMADLDDTYRSGWTMYDKQCAWDAKRERAEPPPPIPIERAMKSANKGVDNVNHVVDEERARRLRERRDA
jgi:hypothetical protein